MKFLNTAEVEMCSFWESRKRRRRIIWETER
jgi:hypothetical protein